MAKLTNVKDIQVGDVFNLVSDEYGDATVRVTRIASDGDGEQAMLYLDVVDILSNQENTLPFFVDEYVKVVQT